MSEQLILPPTAKTVRIYMKDPGDSLSLQVQMCMENCADIMQAIWAEVRLTCRKHGVDLNANYTKQDLDVLADVEREVLAKLAVLREYKDGWPITQYLKMELKPHHQVFVSSVSHLRGLRPSRTRGDTNAHISRSNARQQGASVSAARTTRMYVEVPTMSRRLRRSQAQSSSPVSASPTSATVTSSASQANSGSILNLLLSYSLPLTDAQRLDRLFASLGIVDITYLRVFARMASRDEWLCELRETGEMSEIQVRILREIVERVAAP